MQCILCACAALLPCTHACAIVALWGSILVTATGIPFSSPSQSCTIFASLSRLPFQSLIVSPLLSGATVVRCSKQPTRAIHVRAVQQGAHVASLFLRQLTQLTPQPSTLCSLSPTLPPCPSLPLLPLLPSPPLPSLPLPLSVQGDS